MASVESRQNGKCKTYRIRLSDGEHPDRPRIGLGRISKKDANTAKTNIENLVNHCNSGGAITPATQDWLSKVRPFVRKRLETLGLIESQKSKNKTTLSSWIDGYIQNRTDAKSGTVKAMKQAANNLCTFAGKDKLLVDFTEHDADNLRRYLLSIHLAESTTRRRCKYAKQFFAQAIKARITSNNPFAGIPVAGRTNTERQQFICSKNIQKIIEACPNSQWKLIFALARYGGLRIPSELFGLTWNDILWDKKRFVIHSPKTEHLEGKETRICPIFPELYPYLLEVYEQAEAGHNKVITIYSEKNPNLRTQAVRIIERAGVKVWPKLFNNLRSSRETELVEAFPIHVVTAWLGNSPEVAHKHYLQTHEAYFNKAVEESDEKWGTDRGQKRAASTEISRKEPQEEKQGIDATLVNARSYEQMKKGATHCESHPIVPRGIEPLSPG